MAVFGKCKETCYHRKRLWQPGEKTVFADEKSIHGCFEYAGPLTKEEEEEAKSDSALGKILSKVTGKKAGKPESEGSDQGNSGQNNLL